MMYFNVKLNSPIRKSFKSKSNMESRHDLILGLSEYVVGDFTKGVRTIQKVLCMWIQSLWWILIWHHKTCCDSNQVSTFQSPLSFLFFHLLLKTKHWRDPALKKLNRWDLVAARFKPSTSWYNTWRINHRTTVPC